MVQETGAAPQVSTTYFVTYDFNVGAHNVWFNYNNYVQAVGRGQMKVGNVFTVNSVERAVPVAEERAVRRLRRRQWWTYRSALKLLTISGEFIFKRILAFAFFAVNHR